jgi:hypothetical protein
VKMDCDSFGLSRVAFVDLGGASGSIDDPGLHGTSPDHVHVN